MPSLEYQRDGSCIVTADDGEQTTIPYADQATMDKAIQDWLTEPGLVSRVASWVAAQFK